MTDEERKTLIARIAKKTKEAKRLSPEEAMKRLVKSGIYTEDGRLSPRYGGREVAGA